MLLQVRLQEGGDRAGADPTEIPDLVRVASDHGLAVRGLMAVGPKNPALSEASFRSLVALADLMALPIRSIGMSSDFEAAVRAGSTMVRLGASLFGARVE